MTNKRGPNRPANSALPSSGLAQMWSERGATGGSPHSTSFQSFGHYSEFLRSAVADEESLQMGDTLQSLAAQTEALMVALQASDPDQNSVALALVQLVVDLREHRILLLGLSTDWHQFFEFDAHFVALNQFRTLVTRWATDAAAPMYRLPPSAEFDVAAWRLLGAGAMLLDVYEQSRASAPVAQAEAETVPAVVPGSNARSLLGRLSAWWHRRKGSATEQRQSGRRGRRRSDR